MLHFFDVTNGGDDSLARNIGFKEMRTSTFDTKEGKQMKLHRIPVYARHPKTRNMQDALLRLPQQLVSAAYGEGSAAKVRAAIEITQESEAVERVFAELAEATLPTLQKVAMATNRKIGTADLDGLRVRSCGDGGACKLYVDVYRYGSGSRLASRFYRDTEEMTDVPVAQLFSSSDSEERGPKRRRFDGEKEDGTVISITPFRCELLLHIESVLICPSSLKFVMSVREGVVPSDVGIQYSMLRCGKVWGPRAGAAAIEEPVDPADAEEAQRPESPEPTVVLGEPGSPESAEPE